MVELKSKENKKLFTKSGTIILGVDTMSYLINNILKLEVDQIKPNDLETLVNQLAKRLEIELAKKDKSGIYGITQYQFTYNSNRIEGSRLSEDQTIALFQTGTVGRDNDEYRAKDIEEATGHFLMFNQMIQTYQEELSEKLMKQFHYNLKCGVFEDRANGYPIGEYKSRANYVGKIKTALPHEVSDRMRELLDWYLGQEKITIKTLAELHSQYEKIHPFQDGNGRTGRVILFKECLKNNIIPFIIHDENKLQYYQTLAEGQMTSNIENLAKYFEEEQKVYYAKMRELLYVYDAKE